MPGTARELVGDADDHLFLAEQEVLLGAPVEQVWALLEGDAQQRLLRALSDRFVAREVLERLPDGYRCRTTSKARLGRRRSFESVVWLDEPARSVELQLGRRTDLRYTTTYVAAGGGTRLRCEQAYRAHDARFESGAAASAMHRQAAAVLPQRLAAARQVVEAALR